MLLEQIWEINLYIIYLGLMLLDMLIGYIMASPVVLKIVQQQKMEHTLLMEPQQVILLPKMKRLNIGYQQKTNGIKQLIMILL
jgi:hypothetical protein